MHRLKMTIAGVRILLSGTCPPALLDAAAAEERRRDGFCDFFRGFTGPADIAGTVLPTGRLPARRGRKLFETVHPLGGEQNWEMREIPKGYLYYSSLSGKEQVAEISRGLDSFTMFLKSGESSSWDPAALVYDFLQVLLNAWLVKNSGGLLLHSAGLGHNGRGLVFAGESGAGKTTSVNLWRGRAGTVIYNDDRTCLVFHGKRLFLHAVPWHGDFVAYTSARMKPVPVRRIFMLEKRAENSAARLDASSAFARLYPSIFPVFWNRELLAAQAQLLARITAAGHCWRLGFAKDASAAEFAARL